MPAKRVLFIDRDGTLILETDDCKIDSFEKLVFFPEVFQWLGRIANEFDYELVMVTNQDGLGTPDFPEEQFQAVHDFIICTFANEGVAFKEILIDRSYPHENLPTRKPGTGMLKKYFADEYSLRNSLVIGDRITDVKLAANLNCGCIWLNDESNLGAYEIKEQANDLSAHIALQTRSWEEVYYYLKDVENKYRAQQI